MTRDTVLQNERWLLFAFLIAGCGTYDSVGSELPGGGVQIADQELQVGSSGPAVRAVHEYLTRFGYFPNPALKQGFPSWSPIVPSVPAHPDVYDETSAQAVRALQATAGLPKTGVVDRLTRELLMTARCAVPDGIPPVDRSDKFSLLAGKWAVPGSVSWRVVGNPLPGFDMTTQLVPAINSAFAEWSREAPLLQVHQVASTQAANITIRFAWPANTPKALGLTYGPPDGLVYINPNPTIKWSMAWITPPGMYDLNATLTHELGHAVGLGHSSYGSQRAVMYPGLNAGECCRTNMLGDDKAAISTTYDSYDVLPGLAKDIGVNDSGAAWVIGADNYIYKWNESIYSWDWDTTGMSGSAIAVDDDGIPWIVGPQNTIQRRSNADPLSGFWTQVPGTAVDIAVGGRNPSPTVWIVSTAFVFGNGCGGWEVAKWNGTGWDYAQLVAATKISVRFDAAPWIVDCSQGIWKLSSNSVSGTWIGQPGAAWDVGANYFTAYVVGTDSVPGGYGYYVRDQQPCIGTCDNSGASAPALDTWVRFNGAPPAARISVQDVRAWFTDLGLNIYRRSRGYY